MAVTVKFVVAAVLGVPEIVPKELKERPEGSEEPVAKLQVIVPVPPPLCSVALYAEFTVPLGKDVVVIVNTV